MLNKLAIRSANSGEEVDARLEGRERTSKERREREKEERREGTAEGWRRSEKDKIMRENIKKQVGGRGEREREEGEVSR